MQQILNNPLKGPNKASKDKRLMWKVHSQTTLQCWWCCKRFWCVSKFSNGKFVWCDKISRPHASHSTERRPMIKLATITSGSSQRIRGICGSCLFRACSMYVVLTWKFCTAFVYAFMPNNWIAALQDSTKTRIRKIKRKLYFFYNWKLAMNNIKTKWSEGTPHFSLWINRKVLDMTSEESEAG